MEEAGRPLNTEANTTFNEVMIVRCIEPCLADTNACKDMESVQITTGWCRNRGCNGEGGITLSEIIAS